MEYDYLIVGAGSAGATLAARLTDRTSLQVALLEAGPDYRSADAPEAMRSPNPSRIIIGSEFAGYRWDTLTARRTSTQTPRLYWRGRGVGGSSAINGQIAIRGVLDDYENWAANGCTGWGFDDVLPFFNRLETDLRYGNDATTTHNGQPYHGNDGPIPIYRAAISNWGAIDQTLAEAALDLGYGWAADHNAPHAFGVSPYAINSRDGARISTNDGYLEPARGRNNLSIFGDALVDCVLFAGTRAVGVRVQLNGQWQTLRAREVLLCAGAVHSPAILLRSGIGPAAHLKELGVAVRADLPVGEQFQDHPACAFAVNLREDRVPPPGFRHTNCCVRYSSGLAESDPLMRTGDMMIVAMNRLGDSIGRHLQRGAEPQPFGLLTVWVNACHSRGNVRLTSLDPHAQPSVEENMLDDERDRVRMRDGIRRLIDIACHPSAAAAGTLNTGGLDIRTAPSDAALDTWALANAGDTQHGTSSCRMGSANAATSVVDPSCRVIGVDGLRVIDASIMPFVPRANTHLSTVMIGERMAHVLLHGG